ATPQVLGDICRGFDIAPECAVRTGFHRENLTLRFTPVQPADRDALLRERLTSGPLGASRGPSIVYVTLQKTAEDVASALVRAGRPAFAYHAGLEDAERTRVQDWFLESADAVVVA